MKKSIILALLFGAVISCGDNATRKTDHITIDIGNSLDNYPTIDNSKYSVDYEIITLASEEANQIIPSISKVVSHKDYIYMLSGMPNESVFIYKDDGSFVKRIDRGHGPGEFLSSFDIIVDDVTGDLEILDRAFAIHRYSPAGEFKEKIALPKLGDISEFCKVNESDYLIFNFAHSKKNIDGTYFSTTRDGEKLSDYISKPSDVTNMLIGTHIFKSGSDIYINGVYGNTVYKLNDTIISPLITINPILDANSNILHKDVIGDNELYMFMDFRIYDSENLACFSVKLLSQKPIIFDIKENKAYKGLFFDATYMSFEGGDNKGEYLVVNPVMIGRLAEVKFETAIEKEIADKLISMTDEAAIEGNPYLIRVTYKAK